MSEIITQSTRLTLRFPAYQDAALMIKLFNQPDFIDNIRDKDIRTIEAAEEEVNVMHKHQQEHGFSLYMLDTEHDKAIGMCGLVKRPQLDIPDIGFAIRTEFQNQGYITEAGQAVLAHSFGELSIAKIGAIVKPDNLASVAVIQKLGFQFIDGFQMDPSEPTLKYFELTAEDYFKHTGVSDDG